MHASGVRPLPLAPRPRWAAWGLIIRLPTLRSLGIVRRFGRVGCFITVLWKCSNQLRPFNRAISDRHTAFHLDKKGA